MQKTIKHVNALLAYDFKLLGQVFQNQRFRVCEVHTLHTVLVHNKNNLPAIVESSGLIKFRLCRLTIPKVYKLEPVCAGAIYCCTDWNMPIMNLKYTGRCKHKLALLDTFSIRWACFTCTKCIREFLAFDI
jgi:hypothetical protein